jgi:hypothetical protein
MFHSISKTFTAGILAVTLAATGMTATATPASANNHRNQGAEAAAIFGGLLLLYGLSQANQNHGNRNLSITHTPRHNPPAVHVPRPQQQNFRVAPSRCFIEGQGFRGYRYRCMQNHASRPNLLPSNCLRNVWTDRGQRTIYGGRCLRNNGWTRG